MAKRVLSIQSHVVSGYVGNKAATFPLQLLGYDVDVVNTVQYSNHAGYRRTGGAKTEVPELDSIFDIMQKNGLLPHTRLLTGYVPDAAALESIADLIRKMKAKNPDLIYLLDPVMGDDNRLYVSSDVVPMYRDVLLPLSTIITPNWFEVELLTGVKIEDVTSIQTAFRILHGKGVEHIVMSSLPLTERLEKSLGALFVDGAEKGSSDTAYSGERLLCITSSAKKGEGVSSAGAVSSVHGILVGRIKGYYSGVGDIFSALVLGHFEGGNGEEALQKATYAAIATTHSIMLSTHKYTETLGEEECPPTDDEKDAVDAERRVRRMRARELRIVQGIDDIQTPPEVPFRIERWEGFWGATPPTPVGTTATPPTAGTATLRN